MQDLNQSKTKKIILDIVKYLNVKNIQGLAGALGENPNKIYAWIKNGKIGDTGAILGKYPEFRKEWLETGDGEMLSKPRIPAIGDQAQPVWHPHGNGGPRSEEEIMADYFIKKGLVPSIGETVNEELGKLDKSKQFIATGKILDLLKKIQEEEQDNKKESQRKK